MALAVRKGAGVTPATIAWLISTMTLPRDVPGAVSREELEAWLRELEQRMLRVSAPGK